jgi:hypothetical protein
MAHEIFGERFAGHRSDEGGEGSVMLTKEQALDTLQDDVGSHSIITVEKANEIGEPFGVVFAAETFRPDPLEPMGPMPRGEDWSSFQGVSSFVVAARLVSAVGADPPTFIGRGTQFRADIRAAMKVVAAA